MLLNTEAWRKDDEFGNDDLRQIFEHFSVPLQQAGVEGSIEDVLEEWRELVDYAVSYRNVENVSYPQLWYKIFNGIVFCSLQSCYLVFQSAMQLLKGYSPCSSVSKRDSGVL